MDDPALLLAVEHEAASAQVVDLTEELAGIVAGAAADAPDDEHDVEGASIGFERARVIALLALATARLDELDRAGARLSAGDYGRCDACGAPIPGERLAALPAARTCVGCAPAGGTRLPTASWDGPADRGARPDRRR